jgi:hypothetical protein
VTIFKVVIFILCLHPRRRKHIVRLDVFDLDHRLVRIVVSWTKPCPTPRAQSKQGQVRWADSMDVVLI